MACIYENVFGACPHEEHTYIYIYIFIYLQYLFLNLLFEQPVPTQYT